MDFSGVIRPPPPCSAEKGLETNQPREKLKDLKGWKTGGGGKKQQGSIQAQTIKSTKKPFCEVFRWKALNPYRSYPRKPFALRACNLRLFYSFESFKLIPIWGAEDGGVKTTGSYGNVRTRGQSVIRMCIFNPSHLMHPIALGPYEDDPKSDFLNPGL